MGNLFYTFAKQKGWRHLLLGIAITYILLYWGASEYAKDAYPLEPSTALRSLSTSGLRYFVYPFFIFWVGILLENVQNWLSGAVASKWDVLWGVFGCPIAFVLYLILPQSQILFIVCLALLAATIGLLISWIVDYYKRKK